MPIPYGIAAYSFGYLTGWMGKGTPHENPRPLDVHGLMDLAEGSGLGGVEFPPHMVPDKSDAGFDALGAELRSRGLTPVFDGSNVLDPALPEWVEAAHRVGSPTVRVVLSGILCGDRSPMAGKWQEHLENAVWALRAAEPTARKLGISIAVENHQDADSRDLVWICEQVGSPHVGVNLDAGNALSVGEDPIEFAQRIAPYLKNVHLKDYLMFPTESGYRLVRCAVGDGVLDWPRLFALFDREAPEATRNIELGAMKDRHIRLLEPSWWEHFPPRDARTLLGPMRLLMTQGQPADAEYRVPYDRGESLAVQEAYERDQFERSVRYLKSVTES